jgi:hypothetical protein
MNRFLKWLGRKLFPQTAARSSAVNKNLRSSGPPKVRVRKSAQPEPVQQKKPDSDDGVPTHIEDGGPGKNVYVRSRYVREETGTHDNLKIVDESLVEEQDEGGLDPYNTGRFDRSKTWNLRSGK